MATRVVAPASEIAELAKQRDPYYNQYLQLLTSSAQTGLEQSTEQIQQRTSANIAQAYSNYLAQQRTFAEYPTISSGDVARLSAQGQSAYSTAYQAYKSQEAKDIYSTALDYQEQLQSSIGQLNKQYGEYGSKIRQVEEALLEYMPSAVNKYYAEQVSSGKMTQEEANAILSDENLYNKSDLSKEYLIALSGLNEQGESFYTTLLRDNPNLADWAIQNRELFERTALGDYYADTSNTVSAREKIQELSEKENLYNSYLSYGGQSVSDYKQYSLEELNEKLVEAKEQYAESVQKTIKNDNLNLPHTKDTDVTILDRIKDKDKKQEGSAPTFLRTTGEFSLNGKTWKTTGVVFINTNDPSGKVATQLSDAYKKGTIKAGDIVEITVTYTNNIGSKIPQTKYYGIGDTGYAYELKDYKK